MKVYVLVHNKVADTGSEWDHKLFTTIEAAKEAMNMDFELTLKSNGITNSNMVNDDQFGGNPSKRKFVWNGKIRETWNIEEQELDIKVAIKVHGGLVQSAIANADVDLDVYDLDISGFPAEGEEVAADERRRMFDELASRPDWRSVW